MKQKLLEQSSLERTDHRELEIVQNTDMTINIHTKSTTVSDEVVTNKERLSCPCRD
jgi:hypothetical protein